MGSLNHRHGLSAHLGPLPIATHDEVVQRITTMGCMIAREKLLGTLLLADYLYQQHPKIASNIAHRWEWTTAVHSPVVYPLARVLASSCVQCRTCQRDFHGEHGTGIDILYKD